MPCNLNFNQCNNIGGNFPTPIFNCRRNLINLLNQSTVEVINPVIEPSLLISALPNQTVFANGLIIPTTTFSNGSSILYDNLGTFTLLNGRYTISYNVTGTIPVNGTSSYALFLNGVQIPSSQISINGSAGNSSTTSNTLFININQPTGELSIRNTNINSQTIENGSITIQKIV